MTRAIILAAPLALSFLLASCDDSGLKDDTGETGTDAMLKAQPSATESIAAVEETGETTEPAQTGEPAWAANECGENKVIFACAARNGKRIRVCRAEGDQVTYRYGGADRAPELERTAAPDWASVAYSGGGESQLRFQNSGTEYLVFSRMVRTNFEPGEPNEPEITDGVIVRRGGKEVSRILCDGPVASVDVNALSEMAEPKGGTLFTENE